MLIKNVWLRVVKLAIWYLLKAERHEGRVSSVRQDYDTYWIIFTREEPLGQVDENLPDDQKFKRIKLIVQPEPEKDIWVCEPKKTDQDEPMARILTLDILDGAQYEIRHFFKDCELEYSGPVLPAILRLTRIYWLTYLMVKIFELRHSLPVKQLKDRLEVLDAVIKLQDAGVRDIGYFRVANEIRGPRASFVRSRSRIAFLRQVRMCLDSLRYTGELVSAQGSVNYRPTGKALASKFEWERELRSAKHQANREHILILLTLFIAFGTVAQALKP